ncbi:hypothetical protein V6N13_130507 [Hibiscus sabdariffa]|uniref:Uncharacterized protein n=1 Tax=Hibiscus sabdariffa TaxID=183260 RepID=A0ABR2B824_9ROSI
MNAVLVMERLGHVIHNAVNQRSWIPKNSSVRLSRTDGVLDVCQGGRPSEAIISAGNAIVLDNSVPVFSSAPVQETNEDPVVDASMTDMGPMSKGVALRNIAIGTGLGGVPEQLPAQGQSIPNLSFKDTLLERTGTPTGSSAIPELDVEESCGITMPIMAEKDNIVEQQDPEELYNPQIQVVNRKGRIGAIQNNSGVKGDMGLRYSVLVEEHSTDEGRLEPEVNDGSQGFRILSREKDLTHHATDPEVMIVNGSHGVANERSLSTPGNKEGPVSSTKKESSGE